MLAIQEIEDSQLGNSVGQGRDLRKRYLVRLDTFVESRELNDSVSVDLADGTACAYG